MNYVKCVNHKDSSSCKNIKILGEYADCNKCDRVTANSFELIRDRMLFENESIEIIAFKGEFLSNNSCLSLSSRFFLVVD